jgi:hypothetical protein
VEVMLICPWKLLIALMMLVLSWFVVGFLEVALEVVSV